MKKPIVITVERVKELDKVSKKILERVQESKRKKLNSTKQRATFAFEFSSEGMLDLKALAECKCQCSLTSDCGGGGGGG